MLNFKRDDLWLSSEDAARCPDTRVSMPGKHCDGIQNISIEADPENDIRIIDFIVGQCDATHSKQFVDYWLVTNGRPCLICGRDKRMCDFFQELVKRGVFGEDENLLRDSHR